MSGLLYGTLAGVGDAVGAGLAGYQAHQQGRQKGRHASAREALEAGDFEGAMRLQQEAEQVQGLFGPLGGQRVGPKLIGTQNVELPAPATIGNAQPTLGGVGSSVGTPAQGALYGIAPDLPSASGLPTSLGTIAAPQPTVRGYDASRPDFNNPANKEAIRKFVGAPKPAPEFFSLSPGETRYSVTPGEAPVKVASAAPRPTPAPRPRVIVDPLTGMMVEAVPGAKIGVKPSAKPHARLAHNPETGEWFEPVAGMKTPVAASVKSTSKEDQQRTFAANLVARAVAQRLPWAGVRGVEGVGDVVLDTGRPPYNNVLSESQKRQLRDLGSELGYVLYEEPGKPLRLQVLPGADVASLRRQIETPRDPKLITDVTGVRTQDKAGVRVKSPTAWTPQMDSRARRDAEAAVKADHGGFLPEGAKAEIEEEYRLLREARESDLRRGVLPPDGEQAGAGAAPAGPSALQEMREMMKADKAKRGRK